jgi:hypothetical protein
MRRELVAMGYASAAEAPDAYFLAKLYSNDPDTEHLGRLAPAERAHAETLRCGDDAGDMSWRAVIRFARLCGKARALAGCVLEERPPLALAPQASGRASRAIALSAHARAPP